MEHDRLAALVRQHAMTSELLGVSFVPSYRRAGSPAAGGTITEVKPIENEARANQNVPAVDAPGVPGSDDGAAASPDSSMRESPLGPDTLLGDDLAPRTGPARERLEALRERYLADAPHERFETDHTSIVFGEGDPEARLMFVGEAPGADEDRLGRPFVGKSGQLLDKMIVAMGLSREAVYIANVLKTRPPGNRTPTIEEARLCAPYLYEQIRIVAPEVIVTLGKSAGQLLLGSTQSMGAMRGQWASFPPIAPLVPVSGIGPIPVMPTYHPAFLLRSYTPENRAMVWADLKMVMDRLGLG